MGCSRLINPIVTSINSIVIPAKAGIHLDLRVWGTTNPQQSQKWIPAFAGMTKVRVLVGDDGAAISIMSPSNSHSRQ
jgi:hypothetical protein